jgi:uncharacterized membrane protein
MKIIEDVKRAKLFGHPVHLMMNHFPAALFPISLILDAAGYFLQDKNFAMGAYLALATGLAGGIIAVITGAVDFMNIPQEKAKAYKIAAAHGGLNILWMGVFAVFFGLRIGEYPDIKIISANSLIITAIAVAGLIFSNYLGGELVLHYGIGLKESHESKDETNAVHIENKDKMT